MTSETEAWLAELEREIDRLMVATDLDVRAVPEACHRLCEPPWAISSCVALMTDLGLTPRMPDDDTEFSASVEIYAFARKAMTQALGQ